MDIKVINKKIGEIKRSGKALQDKIVAVEIANTPRDPQRFTFMNIAINIINSRRCRTQNANTLILAPMIPDASGFLQTS